MDDTSIEANAVVDLSPLRWDVSVAGKNLDLDRYLPTPVEKSEEAVTNVELAAKTESRDLIPIDVIRSLNGHVGVVFENLTAKKLKIDKIELDSTQSNGLVKIYPLRASLYKGSMSSNNALSLKKAALKNTEKSKSYWKEFHNPYTHQHGLHKSYEDLEQLFDINQFKKTKEQHNCPTLI